ncbi:MAG: hypothetical protein U1E66_07775 [Rhodospirillales bacterium]
MTGAAELLPRPFCFGDKAGRACATILADLVLAGDGLAPLPIGTT